MSHLADLGSTQVLAIKQEFKISSTQGGFSGVLDAGDNFGYSLCSLDNDRLVVAAPLDDDGGTDQGAVWVLVVSGNSVASWVKISEGSGGFLGVLDVNDRFGEGVASFESATVGDLDGDGITDLAVGAPGDDDGGVDQGAVWILFLTSSGQVSSHVKISETTGGFTDTFDPGDGFGSSLATIGDLDADGIPDLAVGAANAGQTFHEGALWILFMNANGTVRAQQKVTEGVGGFTGPLTTNGRFGVSLAGFMPEVMGDLDGDSVADLVVGAMSEGSSSEGAIWTLFLNTDGTVKSEQMISSTAGGLAGPLTTSDYFGRSLGSADFDGDGELEIAVGAPGDDYFLDTDQGAVWALRLNTDGTVAAEEKVTDIGGVCPGIAGPLDAQDFFGAPVFLRTAGQPTLAVGARNDDDGGFDAGAVWVLRITPESTATAVPYNACINPNSDILTCTSARLSQTWTSTVTRSPITGPGAFTLLVRPTRLLPCNGVQAPPPVQGRVLISGPLLTTLSGVHNGTTGSVSAMIPCLSSLVGIHWAAQAVLNGPGVKLSSAVEGLVGTL
ncbi:MAG: FG-GAP-like repeat-containing protein [Planctomycetota bacterium]